MTREEYIAKTQIKSVDEARSRLTHLRILFAVVFAFIVLLRGGAGQIDQDTYSLIWVAYIALLIYFVVYCVKVIKLTSHVTKANAFWSIIFAPISWFWFYPEITKPLKIIIGEIEPPEKLLDHHHSEEAKKAREASNKRYWKTVKIVVIIFFALLGVAIAFIVIDSQTHNSPPSSTVSSNSSVAVQPTIQKELGYHYVSTDSGFEADFPDAPTREENKDSDDDGTYVTYEGDKGDSLYYVFYYSFGSSAVDENNPKYNVKSGLEGSLNGMTNGIDGSKITSSNFTTFLGHQALNFTIDASPKTIEGVLFFNGVHLYMVAVEYPTTSTQKPNLDAFKASFTLSNPVSVQAPTADQLQLNQPASKSVNSESYKQDKITASVVNILCEAGDNSSGGSGTILDSSGLIMTNNHIIPEDKDGNPLVKSCLVTLPDSQGKVKEIYYGKPIVIPDLSQNYDLAFIQLSAAYVDDDGTSYGSYPNTFPSFFPDGCENANPTLGEKIRVFGYPAISGGGYYLTLTDGVVSSLPNDGTIVTSAKIDHGSSGGLAVDEQGCLVGVPSMISGDKNESLGVLISDSVVGEFMTKLQEVMKQSGQ
jgi:hypothetical protein